MPHHDRPSLARVLPRAARIALGCVLLAATGSLVACDDQLPAFANPPPYDAGADLDASDEDAG